VDIKKDNFYVAEDGTFRLMQDHEKYSVKRIAKIK